MVYQPWFSDTICEPTLVNNDSDWKSLACGSLNTYLIKEDGTLWVMGADASEVLDKPFHN